MENIDIYDVMVCPNCNGDNCETYNTDEVEFNVGGDGYYAVDCYCKDCGKTFRLCVEFKYSITESRIR